MTHRYIIAIVPAATTGIAIYDTKEKTLRWYIDFDKPVYVKPWLDRRLDEMALFDKCKMVVCSDFMPTLNYWKDYCQINAIDFEMEVSAPTDKSLLRSLGINHRSLSSSIKQAVMIVMEKVK